VADNGKRLNAFIFRMKRKVPKELDRSYWYKSKEERLGIWVKTLVERLDIDEENARDTIEYLRSLPLHEYHSRSFTRFETAAKLLYEMSPKCPYHNRIHGATMVTSSSIYKFSGARNFYQEKIWSQAFRKACKSGLVPYGSMEQMFLHLKLSESNPYQNDNAMEMFSSNDIRRGIRLPKPTEESAIRCVGYVYGPCRFMTEKRKLLFEGRNFALGLHLSIQSDFDQAFNLWEEVKTRDLLSRKQEKKECIIRGNPFEFKNRPNSVLTYTSKAVCSWLVNFGVSKKVNERYLPPKVFDLPNHLKREFIKSLISSGAFFHRSQGTLLLHDTSENFLKGCDDLFTDAGIGCSSPYDRSYGKGHCLSISIDSTRRLWKQGTCSLNPYLQSRMDEFYRSHPSDIDIPKADSQA
jgi:hypothetical protein